MRKRDIILDKMVILYAIFWFIIMSWAGSKVDYDFSNYSVLVALIWLGLVGGSVFLTEKGLTLFDKNDLEE